jgi:hypothetical protein
VKSLRPIEVHQEDHFMSSFILLILHRPESSFHSDPSRSIPPFHKILELHWSIRVSHRLKPSLKSCTRAESCCTLNASRSMYQILHVHHVHTYVIMCIELYINIISYYVLYLKSQYIDVYTYIHYSTYVSKQ